MVHAYVLVKTGAGASSSVVEALAAFDAIDEAHVVAGEYDLILEVDADAVDGLVSFVSGEIQALEGVLDTKTYVALG